MPEIAQAGLDAGVEVGLDDVTADDLVGADAAVVGALRAGEAADREAVGAAVLEERVFLLDAEPGLLRGVLLGDRGQQRAGVAGVGRAVDVVDLAQHQDVVAAPDRVGTREDRLRARGRSRGPRPGWCSNRRKPQVGSSAPSASTLVLDRSFADRLSAVNPDVLGLERHVFPFLGGGPCRWPPRRDSQEAISCPLPVCEHDVKREVPVLNHPDQGQGQMLVITAKRAPNWSASTANRPTVSTETGGSRMVPPSVTVASTAASTSLTSK